MIDTNIILAKLKILASVDSSLRDNVHGAYEHKYRMDATVPLAEIELWERTLHVTLPVGYRNFLLHVGNGPCGPGFGLQRFPQANPSAGEPCQIAGTVVSTSFGAQEEYNKAVCGDKGFLRLSDYGCGLEAILIITGDFSGQIWIDSAGSGDLSPFPPVLHDAGRLETDDRVRYSFLEWYDDWLDCTIDGRAIP
ncbi:MAG: hypothetical protein C0478_18205 [Planctomyces sp.]|nr:hypothetical protein [Planctomyces sp.]